MKSYTCPICGGKLKIRIGAEKAECDSCGSLTDIDAAEVKRYQSIYENAERSMQRHAITGYEDAIRELNRIAFIDEATERIKACEAQLVALQSRTDRQRTLAHASDARDTALGIVILIITLLLCAAAIAGVVWLIVLIAKDALSPTALIIILAVVVLAVLSVIFGGFRRS